MVAGVDLGELVARVHSLPCPAVAAPPGGFCVFAFASVFIFILDVHEERLVMMGTDSLRRPMQWRFRSRQRDGFRVPTSVWQTRVWQL